MRSFFVYDGQGNIVRSIDILGQKEYNYKYDAGKVVRATESDIALSDEMVVSKSLVNTVKYYYDADDKMTKKVITSASDSVQTIYYENSEDNTVVKFNAGGKTITAHSKTDSFGRKVFDELQLGTGFVSRQFSYHSGAVTPEHVNTQKLKSSPTTQLVSQIISLTVIFFRMSMMLKSVSPRLLTVLTEPMNTPTTHLVSC